MNKKYLNLLFLIPILAFGLWLRTYNLGNRYSFEWDQNDDAVKVMRILEGQPTLIGPRVAGPDSFFVSPWHYYFLTPFFAIGKGDPVWAAYAAVLVGILTVWGYYWVGKELWGVKEGLISAWAGAVAFSIVSWNVMYTPLLAMAIFYLGKTYFVKQKNLLMMLALSIFAGTVHLVPVTLVVMVTGVFFLSKKRPSLKSVIIGIMIGLLSIIPLVLFDLRHNFLIVHKVFQFLTAKGEWHSGFFNLLAWRAYWRGFSLLGYQVNEFWYIVERVLLIATVLIGIGMTKEKRVRVWEILWFVFPAIILLFYWKNIPEYYFGVPLSLIPLYLGKVSKKNLVVVALFLAVSSYLQMNRVLTTESQVSLNDKKEVVAAMVNYANKRPFNFSYDVPFGEEIGYPYLFTWMKHEPENTPEANLYTLSRNVIPGETVIYSKKGLSIIKR